MKAVSNLFSSSSTNNNNNRRRSTPATMYDLIDNGYDISTAAMHMSSNNDADYTDGFWKVFMLNDKPGKTTRCCERSSSFNTQGCQDSKMSSAEITEQGGGLGATCYCMKHSKTARRRRFKSQSGYYLAIMPNGQIMGVKDKSSLYSKFSFSRLKCPTLSKKNQKP